MGDLCSLLKLSFCVSRGRTYHQPKCQKSHLTPTCSPEGPPCLCHWRVPHHVARSQKIQSYGRPEIPVPTGPRTGDPALDYLSQSELTTWGNANLPLCHCISEDPPVEEPGSSDSPLCHVARDHVTSTVNQNRPCSQNA